MERVEPCGSTCSLWRLGFALWLAAAALAVAGLPTVAPPPGVDYLAWKRAALSQRTAKSAKDVLLSNDCVRLGVGFEGAWGLATTGGDPADPTDDGLDLTFSLTGSSNSLALKVDGVLHVLDESSPEIVSAADGTSVSATWAVAGLLLQARYELVDSGSGRADTAKVTYTVTNPAPKELGEEHSVSLKLGLDIDIANAYARLLTPAGVVTVESGFGRNGSGGSYGLPVPDFWQGFQRDSLADPGLIGQGTFVGAGATPPDKVVIGSWSTVTAGSSFDYQPSAAACGDSAVALWWLDRSLPVGASLSCVVLYGMGQMSRGGTTMALGISAPFSLGPTNTPFAPNPFSVVAQVQNFGTEDLPNLPVTIALPGCLSLATGASTQFVAALGAGASTLVTFRLDANPDCAGQIVNYTVSAGLGEAHATVERTLELPAAPPVTVTFLAAPSGSLSGLTVQTLPRGGDCSPILATPGPDQHFVRWTHDGLFYSFDNPLSILHVQADMTLTAEFANDFFTVRFEAGVGGSLEGVTVQQVLPGGNTSAVTAVPAYGHAFAHWDDGPASNPRSVTGVMSDQTVVAIFALAGAVAPDGEFLALTSMTDRGIWDLSGVYTLDLEGSPLVLHLLHDAKGRLAGSATYTLGKAIVAELAIRGSVKGGADGTVLKIALRGADPDRVAKLALALDLTLAPRTAQLVGALTGSISRAGSTVRVGTPVELLVQAPMDGSWTLRLQLTSAGRVVTGSALLTLSNGVVHAYLARGRMTGPGVLLTLAGSPSDPLLRGVTLKAHVATLAEHWATLHTFSGESYGQDLTW